MLDEKIEVLKSNSNGVWSNEIQDAFEYAVACLEELKTYRSIGTIEEFRSLKEKNILPESCIQCKEADFLGYCNILNERHKEYAIKRHKKCPLEGK